MTMVNVTGPGARERLKAELRDRHGPDPKAVRAQAEADARGRVDAFPVFGAMTDLGEGALAAGESHYDSVLRQKKDLRNERFKEWSAEDDETYTTSLSTANAKFEGLAAKVPAAFPMQVISQPATAVDALNLAHFRELFYQASPSQAGRLVDSAISGGNRPLLASMDLSLRSWVGSRNVWSSTDGVREADRLLRLIDLAMVSADQFAAELARERTEEYRRAWRLLVNLLLDSGGKIDPVHRTVGALAPLLPAK